MKFSFEQNAVTTSIDITPTGKTYRATVGEETVEVEVLRAQEGQLELLIDGQRVTAYISSDGAKRWVTIHGQTVLLTKSAEGARRSKGAHHHAAGELTAPMPGQIRALNVSEGEAVTKGQTLMVLEAMKMEIRIQTTLDGKVGKLFVRQGQTVEREQALVEIE